MPTLEEARELARDHILVERRDEDRGGRGRNALTLRADGHAGDRVILSSFDPLALVCTRQRGPQSIDPFGAVVREVFRDRIREGYDIRPSIAVTKAHLQMPEIREAIAAGRLTPDSTLLKPGGDVGVTKAAVEPVWHLPGIAKRFGTDESSLRRTLFEQTGGMFPELVTRGDLDVFLPLSAARPFTSSGTRTSSARARCR